jgi:hypothetical protein
MATATAKRVATRIAKGSDLRPAEAPLLAASPVGVAVAEAARVVVAPPPVAGRVDDGGATPEEEAPGGRTEELGIVARARRVLVPG